MGVFEVFVSLFNEIDEERFLLLCYFVLNRYSVKKILVDDVGFEALEVGVGEGGGETEVLKGMDVTMEASIVEDGLSLVVVDIGVATELLEGQAVDVQLRGLRVGNHKIFLGLLRKIVDFIELIDTDIASQPLTATHDLFGKIRSDARHCLEGGGVGGIEGDVGAGSKFLGEMVGMGDLGRMGQPVNGGGIPSPSLREGRGGPKQRGGREVVTGDANIGFEASVFLDGEAIEACKVFFFPKDATLLAVAVEIAYLPGLETQLEELGRVGGVGIERKCRWHFRGERADG